MTAPQQSSLVGISASAITAHLNVGPVWESVFDEALPLYITGGMAGYTVRLFIRNTVFGGAASRMRLSFYGPKDAAMEFRSCHIGHQSGDTFGFAEAPTPVTFDGGTAGVTVASLETKTSDIVNFAYDGSRSVILAFYIPFGTAAYSMSATADETDFITAYKNTGTVDDSASVAISGYYRTDSWARSALQRIEVFR